MPDDEIERKARKLRAIRKKRKHEEELKKKDGIPTSDDLFAAFFMKTKDNEDERTD